MHDHKHLKPLEAADTDEFAFAHGLYYIDLHRVGTRRTGVVLKSREIFPQGCRPGGGEWILLQEG